MRLSQYVYKFENGDTVCYYHALKNLPIYYSKEQDAEIMSVLDKQVDVPDLPQSCQQLFQYGFFINSPDDDAFLLQYYKNGLPQPGITIAYFILSEDCNMSCSYCFLGNGKKIVCHNNNMSTAIAQKSIEEFVYQTCCSGIGMDVTREIIFYGGEPLLSFKTLSYIVNQFEEMSLKGEIEFPLHFSIVTNGTLISEEVSLFFAKHNISVSISLDGPFAENNTHRVFKNQKAAYPAIIDSIHKLQKANVPFGISLTLSDASMSVSVADLVAFLKVHHVDLISMNTMLYAEQNNQAEDYYEKAVQYIIDFWNLAKEEGIYEDRILRKLESFANQQFYYTDCAATGGSQVVFTPEGLIGVCHGLLESKAGYIFSLGNKDNINSHPLLKEWTYNSPIMRKECYNCPAIGVCGGGCPLSASKSKHHIDTGFCIHTKQILQYMIWELFKNMEKGLNEEQD